MIIKQIILILPLLFCSPALGVKTIIIPVADLLMVVPTFDDAPNFNFNNAFQGNNIIGDLKKSERKSKKKREQELVELIEGEYPDALSVRIWNSNMIIRLP